MDVIESLCICDDNLCQAIEIGEGCTHKDRVRVWWDVHGEKLFICKVCLKKIRNLNTPTD